MSNILPPQEHVLSTLEADGSRRWLRPKLSHGKLLERRRWLAYVLIAIFTLIPFIKVNGNPLVLLDIPARRFTILGFTFLPTDTVLLAIFMVGLLLSVFLFTALFGRIWCGWACPQTVYMEFLFRPIERFFDGTVGRGGHRIKAAPWRVAGKYLVYFLLCVYLANTFIAYFIGVDRLLVWVTQSPLNHPIPFLVMAFVTFAMMVDFCFFREQMCIIACPYGRFQSVLLDRNSIIVAYDQNRGEPRGKLQKKGDRNLPVLGDCIDCGNCVTTCPTGIDIRAGLQMECINCTQCIDACNEVMQKIGRAPDLIRYSSQARDEGLRTHLFRARTAIYPLLLLGIVSAFFTVFLKTKTFDAALTRGPGNPYIVNEANEVINVLKLTLTNRSDQEMVFRASVLQPEGVRLQLQQQSFNVPPRETISFHLNSFAPKTVFRGGRAKTLIEVVNDREISRTIEFVMLGP
jgi:cytochrome c oxidase accessory protein FixG